MKIFLLTLISWMALLGCQTPEQSQMPPAASDRADVPILDSTELLWTGEDAWTIEENPTLDIGRTDERACLYCS